MEHMRPARAGRVEPTAPTRRSFCGRGRPRSVILPMKPHLLILCALAALPLTAAEPPQLSGELKHWHKVTLTFEGPFARESDTDQTHSPIIGSW